MTHYYLTVPCTCDFAISPVLLAQLPIRTQAPLHKFHGETSRLPVTDGQGWPLVGEDDIVSKEVQWNWFKHAYFGQTCQGSSGPKQQHDAPCHSFLHAVFSLALLKFFGAFCFLLGLLTFTFTLELEPKQLFFSFQSSLHMTIGCYILFNSGVVDKLTC